MKKAGSAVYYLLSWDGTDAPEELVPQEDFNFDDEEAEESSCNTQKHHGAKMCHTSAGILIGCSPCGVIPLFEELFGSESKSQVFSHVTDFLGEVNPKSMMMPVTLDLMQPIIQNLRKRLILMLLRKWQP